MPQGIEIVTEDGFSTLTFLDKAQRGPALKKLLDIGGPELIDVDTSGTHKSYVVPESIAIEAGLIDTPSESAKAAPKAEVKKAPAKKVAAKKAPAKKAAPKPAAEPEANPFASKDEEAPSGEWS